MFELYVDGKNNELKYCRICTSECKNCFSYSARDLQEELKYILNGQKLMAIYSEADAFTDCNTLGYDSIDFVYATGDLYYEFENCLLSICITGEGRVNYGIYMPDEYAIETVKELPQVDSSLVCSEVYIEIQPLFPFPYIEKRVKDVLIGISDIGTAFDSEGYDSSAADETFERNDLPNGIAIFLEEDLTVNAGPDEDSMIFWFGGTGKKN